MNALIKTFNTRFLPMLSLENSDRCWRATIDGSAVCRPIVQAFVLAANKLSGLSALGSNLQWLSFACVALLFLILPAPVFANDKEGLAVLIVGAVAMRALGCLLAGKEKYKPLAVDGIILLYFASNVVSSIASHYMPESLIGLAKLFVYVLAYFLFVGCFQIQPRKRILITIAALIAAGAAVSLYGLYQYKIGVAPLATWEDPTIEDRATRIYGTLGNPNLLAGYLVPLIPLSLTLAGAALLSPGRWRWLTLPGLAVAALITLATVLTASRGGYIGILFEMFVIFVIACEWVWLERPKWRLPLAALVILIPLATVAVVHFKLPLIEHRFLSIFAGGEHSSNAYRMNVWHSSLAMCKDSWWLGIGTGNKTFRLAYGLYMRSSYDALGAYCVPLEVAVETGIPGLLLFAWLVVTCIARGHSRFWTVRDPIIRLLAAGSAVAVIGMMAHGLVDTVFYRPQVQFIFWLAVAILVALPGEPSDQATEQTG